MYDIENFKRYMGDVNVADYIVAFDKIEEEIEDADIDLEYYENKCQRLRFVLQGMKMDSKYTLSEQKQWAQYFNYFKKYVEFKDFVESNNKDAFSSWLGKQPQKSNPSKVYSEKSCYDFVKSLEKGLTKHGRVDEYSANFFLVNEVNEVLKRKEKYEAFVKEYDDGNKNRDLSNGIEFYLQFLIEKKRKLEIRKIIRVYKTDFDLIDEEERYKWEAVKHYKENWNIDAPDFANMVEKAFAKTFNLLTAGQYYALKMLKGYSSDYPEEVRKLFKILYDESLPLEQRFDDFRAGFESYVSVKKINHYQDLHAISVYLTFEYPEKYYIYKYGVWTGFLKNINESIPSSKGKHETFKIESSNKLCDEILSLVVEDTKLLLMSQSRLTNDCYQDTKFKMLAFDIMYYGSHYEKAEEDGWWPSNEEYSLNLTKDDWTKYILEVELPEHPSPMQMLKAMMELGGIASCKQLSQKFGGTVSYYVGCTINLGRRVKKHFNLPACIDGDQERYFPFPFLGKAIDDEDGHQYLYKIRPELLEALNEIDLSDISPYYKGGETMSKTDVNINTILYGPPGTGKTYITARYAVAIIENKSIEELESVPYDKIIERYNEYKSQGRIEFTTFHQSYGYEEFIEGIKPVISEGNEIQYKVESGLFKSFCEKVGGEKTFDEAWDLLVEFVRENDNRYIFTRRTGTKISAELRDEESFVVKWNGETQTQNVLGKARIKNQWEEDDYTTRESLSGGSKWLFDANQAVIDELISSFGLKYKVNENTSRNYVFIIDEINRGNISKIFGELITLIEPTKRLGEDEGVKVKLPYSQKLFGVPNNVYIIGTMNTADRSIAAIDTALRRRFAFKEMMPDASVIKDITVDGVDVSALLELINERIEVLYDREHTIGHAYFTPLLKEKKADILFDIFRNKIFPLLQEYFYEDYEKIRLVLGDNQKAERSLQFINEESVDYGRLFGSNIYDYDDKKVYKINEAAFKNIEAYKEILKGRL